MAENYIVRSIHIKGTLPPPARQVTNIRYPPDDIPGVVTTELQLWEVATVVGGFFTYSYWRSFFNHTMHYNVVLYQEDPVSKQTVAFVVHETAVLTTSEVAFERLRGTVEPLVDDCNVLFTSELLSFILLPEPVEPSKLPFRLMDAIQKHPRAHPDWFRVVHSLTLSALRKDDHEHLDAMADQVDAGVTDRKGNSALHLASSAKTVRRFLALTSSDKEKKALLKQTNKEGKTALEIALEHSKADVVSELVEQGARLPPTATSLHVAAERRHTRALAAAFKRREGFFVSEGEEAFALGDALDSLNEQGLTPLMVSALNGHLEGLIIFLQAGADPNVQHVATGFTAMHWAAQVGCHDIIKFLIAFGASGARVAAKDGRTPLDVARASGKVSEECVKVLEETTLLMDEAERQFSESPEPVAMRPDALVLLSMDGGGSRGLLICQTILAIQNRMRQLEPRCGPVYKYCDYVAGTSTGGLVGLSMAFGASLGATRATFFKVAEEVFAAMSPTFSRELVEETSKKIFGTEKFITDIRVPRLIMTTVLADQNPSVLHLLCNYGEARNGQKPPGKWKAWEVGCATSAAPFYFPLFEGKFLDGGVMANNPTLDAMVEIFNQAEREGKAARLGLVLSLGTGMVPSSKVDNVGIFVPNVHNLRESIPGLLKTFSGLTHMLQLFIGQCTRSDGEEVERARTWCKTMGTTYVRLSCLLKGPIDLAEPNKVILTELMYQGTLYNLRRARDIDTVARCLLRRGQRY